MIIKEVRIKLDREDLLMKILFSVFEDEKLIEKGIFIFVQLLIFLL